MALQPLPATDTRLAFRPLAHEFLDVLRSIDAERWERPTVAGAWRVRDVLAHLTDTALRRVSFQRDRHTPPSPPTLDGEAGFVRFINDLNAAWVAPMRRVSPAVLVDLFALASTQLADTMESLPLDAPALFPVSWAGEDGHHGWLDVARDFTEQWHHQMQIRDAIGAPPPSDPEWLRLVLLTALRGLPHSYRAVPAAEGTTIVLDVTGPSGGVWTLRRDGDRWTLWSGEPAATPAAHVAMSDDSAWRLLFNALPAERARARVQRTGEPALVEPMLRARSVIV